MTEPINSCDPTQQCCLPPEEELFSPEAPVCSVPPSDDSFSVAVDPALDDAGVCSSVAYFTPDPMSLPGFPLADEAPQAPSGTNWVDMDIGEIQGLALTHHQDVLAEELARMDLEFAREVDTLTHHTEPGQVYSVRDNMNVLPGVAREQIVLHARATFHARAAAAGIWWYQGPSDEELTSAFIEGLAFTWAWNGDRPELFMFRPNSAGGQQQVSVVVNEEDGQIYVLQNPTTPNRIQWLDNESDSVVLPSLAFDPEGNGEGLIVTAPVQPDAGTHRSEIPLLTYDAEAWNTDRQPSYVVAEDGSLVLSNDFHRTVPIDPSLANLPTGDEPQFIVLSNREGEESDPTANLLGEDGTMAAAGFFALGSLRPNPAGGGSNGVRPGLPVNRMLIQGGIGAGIFLGIHYGVVEMGVPEHLAPYVDVPATLGTFALVDSGSAFLAEQGFLNQRVFPNGIQWGNVAHAAPFFVVGSVTTGFALDGLGCEFGTTCNTVGTVGITTTGYVGLSQTTGLLTTASEVMANPAAAESVAFASRYPRVMAFAQQFPRTTTTFTRLGTAYGTATGVGLTPATINIGSRTLTLGAGVGSAGGGVFLAGGGVAGGGGVLGGGLQVIGAVGVVALGSWVGGGIVDFWAWASGNSDDPDYQLIDYTWDYMNVQVAGSFINAIFGPVIRGIQSIAISDEVWEGMELHWGMWSRGCNDWADGIDGVLLSLALSTTTGSGFDTGNPDLSFHYEPFAREIERFYTSDTKPEGCGEDDGPEDTNGQGDRCISNSEAVEMIYGTVDRLRPSSQGYRLDDNTEAIRDMIPQDGEMGSYRRSRVEAHLRRLVSEGQENGQLRRVARRVLRGSRRQLGQNMVDLGLARFEGEDVVPIHVDPSDLTDAQLQFLYGGRAVYGRVTRGEITDRSQIQSDYIVLRQRIDALEHIMEVTGTGPNTSQPDVADLLFGSRRR